MSLLSSFFPSSPAPDVNADAYADIIIVAGGGGGATSSPIPSPSPYYPASLPSPGGGGGGIHVMKMGLFCGTTYPIVVGAGGAASPTTVGCQGSNGSNSSFCSGRYVAMGGGGAGSMCWRGPCGPYQPAAAAALQSWPGRPGGQGGSSLRATSPTYPQWGTGIAIAFGSSSSFATRCGYHYGDAMNYSTSNPTYNTRIRPRANGLDLGFCQLLPACGVSFHGSFQGSGCCSPPALCFMSPNTGNGGVGINNGAAACAGNSGFVVVSYPTITRAAPSFPGGTDCSPCTPGFRTYLFKTSGSITI